MLLGVIVKGADVCTLQKGKQFAFVSFEPLGKPFGIYPESLMGAAIRALCSPRQATIGMRPREEMAPGDAQDRLAHPPVRPLSSSIILFAQDL